jgi:hypothetical protein
MASRLSRRWTGGSVAVAADSTAIVSCTERTSSVNAYATSGGAVDSRRSISTRSSSATACRAYGVARSRRSVLFGSFMRCPDSS